VSWFEEELTCDDDLADFSAGFRRRAAFRREQPVVGCAVGVEDVLEMCFLGIVYPSVRRKASTCIA
jgi:hypothetical protein